MPFRYWLYLGLLGLFGAHFGLTALYVSPPNPLKIMTSDLHQGYIGRFFYQDWGLFAPDPVRTDFSIYGECLNGEEGSGVYNLSRPVQDKRRVLPMSQYDRLSRVVTYYPLSYVSVARVEDPLRLYCDDPERETDPACLAHRERVDSRQQAYEIGMIKVVSSFCRELARETGQKYDQVRVGFSSDPVPGWSQRYQPVREETIYDLGVHPIDPEVMAHGIWK